ncbi:hypothetical protein [Nitrosomonas sp. Nm33]|uniref:hypothetical protein n=1 Tax=Nitrosomonas sp. Nm33 TaxID=133724 RepID=UPI0015A466DB|nr:hypothetical protein [Nitrosomonas sp. Nm33]
MQVGSLSRHDSGGEGAGGSLPSSACIVGRCVAVLECGWLPHPNFPGITLGNLGRFCRLSPFVLAVIGFQDDVQK